MALKSLSGISLFTVKDAPPARRLCKPLSFQFNPTAFITFNKFRRIVVYEIGLFFLRSRDFLHLEIALKVY